MTKQPEALRLADALDEYAAQFNAKSEAAAELRRLHEVNQEWERKAATWLASPEAAQRLDGYRELAQRINYLETMNQELLEALDKLARLGNGDHYGNSDGNMIARAAIAKATGEQA
jgi:hypothetical protein